MEYRKGFGQETDKSLTIRDIILADKDHCTSLVPRVNMQETIS